MSKVVLVPCNSYDENEVYNAVNTGINLLGGISNFVKQDEKILLKPNILKKATVSDAVTTNPMVFKAVAKILKENGCNNLSYGDSPATHSPDKAAISCGIAEIANEMNIDLADFHHGTDVYLENAMVCDKFHICNGITEADSVINICKMKTHALERITGAVKNLYGCVQGLKKGYMHTQYSNSETFADMLIDLNKVVNAKLHIMDGVTAMEGNGPASGTPVNMNVILISKDPVALDSVFCSLIDLNPKLVPTNISGKKGDLGEYDFENIAVLTPNGEFSVEEISNKYGKKDFDVRRGIEANSTSSLSKIINLLQRRPAIDKSKCIKCSACVKACPLTDKALSQKSKDNFPKYDYKKCIRCYCCQEICPQQAIDVKEPLLAKVFNSK